ncbi:class I SAM-dependent methyltransferase [Methylocystis sp. H4A]|uniref:class I SAM-dependent methyltransferase n=1 Tax=Methylocystis sp. H4A TaxID=2785788 RepID=UPI0018C2DF14|nr:class I SAM-dependent methyltransferase [Methylocystis sp. H4A]MBG0803561.1 class I SAM-dependent methyltransferase [Methylocystis sp. H4A]
MNARQTMVFGDNAGDYRAFRPHYPDALFAWLASAARQDRLAWDCGAGSGQAALGLSRHFTRVLATDPDPRQLALAPKEPNVDYRLARAEDDLGLRAEVDLIACACSIHWFDLPNFYANARRALRPEGIIAAWTYDWPRTHVEPLDAILRRLKEDILGPFWAENSALYFERYETLPFPFKEIDCPPFQTPVARSKGDLVSFLKTWSAVEKYRLHYGRDPLALVDRELEEAWRAHPPDLPLCVPLYMRCGVNTA